MNAIFPLLPFVLIVAIGGLIIGAIAWSVRAERKRTAEMQQVAASMGLPFYETGNPALVSELSAFQLFSRGHAKRTKNMIHGETDEVELGIFDYQYTTGSGKNSHTWRQTVVYFHASDLNLPQFALRPEGLFDKLGGVFGFQDIDFVSHPTFSGKYVLRGADEERIRAAFHDGVLAHFASQSGVSVEADGQRLIYYRAGRLTTPQQVRQLMEEGFQVYTLFRCPSAK
jgi:hypothetical protein